MKQKLTLFMLTILLLGSALPVNSAVPPFEKQSARGIAEDQFQPFLEEQEKNSPLCVIQNDDDTAYYILAQFDSGAGFVVWMDPAKCSANPTYPFEITEVHFPIYYKAASGWSNSPVHLQVSIKQALQGNKCLGPDTLSYLFSQSFTIPIDSSDFNLGRPMHLSLRQPCCVSQPFFLEIKYLDHLVTNDTLPSLEMDQLVESPDTCNNWGLWTDGYYYKWSDFWGPPTPGDAIIRAGGYAGSSHCDPAWYWKPDKPTAPSGMPDFDQNQDAWGAMYCSPTAAANCLWWFGAVPNGWTPPQLIDTLARYFHTTTGGTYTDTMQMGLMQYIKDYGFAFQESTFLMPDFYEMEDSLKVCQDIILCLGFWYYDGTWHTTGGHAVTMAGVCSESLKVAFSDPDTDNAESGGLGRVRPPHAAHPEDHTLHNNPAYVSQDMFGCIINPPFPSPGSNRWEIANYIGTKTIERYSGINIPERFMAYAKPAPKDEAVVWHTVVEDAIMICPKPSAVGRGEESGSTPEDFELYQNHPNPFNSETLLRFNLKRPSFVTLVLYNVMGQKVRTLAQGHFRAGLTSVSWDGKDEKGNTLASGIYFYELKAGEASQTKRMLLLK
ncbi:MAG: FlgD immunoglobulin-like domain containing protein [Candidatus Zixiibacteriota bacterium]